LLSCVGHAPSPAGKLIYRLRDIVLLMVVAGFIALIH